MSIRAQFEPKIDAYLVTLREFATGAYLREEERDAWDQPFDPEALDPLREILLGFVAQMDKVAPQATIEDATPIVSAVIDRLHQLNERYADAVLEPEEFDELNAFFRAVGSASGLSEEKLENLPELESR